MRIGRVLVSALEEVEQLIRLAEDLLLLSRSTAGLSHPRSRVEVEPLVLEVAELGARLGQGQGRRGAGSGPVAPLAVHGGCGALRRSVLEPGRERGQVHAARRHRVELTVVAAGADAVLAVEDTGPGIDEADATQVFEAFVRLDAARARGDRRQWAGPGHRAVDRRSRIAGPSPSSARAAGGSRFTIRLPRA